MNAVIWTKLFTKIAALHRDVRKLLRVIQKQEQEQARSASKDITKTVRQKSEAQS